MIPLPADRSAIWFALGWTMLHFVWVGAAVGLAALSLRRALDRAAPTWRYAAALVCLAALVAAPCVIFAQVYKAAGTGYSLPLPSVAEAMPPAAAVAARASTAPPLPALGAEPPLAAQILRALDRAAQWAPWLWIAGAPLTLSLLAAGVAGGARLRHTARPIADTALVELGRSLAEVLAVGQAVVLAVSDRVVTPLVVGVLRPVVILPAAALGGWTPEQLEMILLHELAHVRRGDNLVNLVQRLVESLLFFHPVVWWVSSWARLEREHCCDAVVLGHTGRPQEYAETLAALAMPGLAPSHAAAVMANHQLLGRIRHILKVQDVPLAAPRKSLAALGALAAVATVVAAAWAQQTPEKPAPKSAAAQKATVSGGAVQRSEQAFIAELEVPQHAGGNDAELLRRALLNLTGKALQAEEVEQFLSETSAGGRRKLIEWLSQAPGNQPIMVDRDFDVYVAQGDGGVRDYAVEAVEKRSRRGTQGAPGTTAQKVTQTAAAQPGSTASTPHAPAANWSASQATGKPDTPQAGDHPTAWASRTPDGQQEWLELIYAQPVEVTALLVYETHNPGAVATVLTLDEETGHLEIAWTGKDPTSPDRPQGVSVITFPARPKTKLVRLVLDSPGVPGWNEIDAVGLLDGAGQVHWAVEARASSSFATVAAGEAGAADGKRGTLAADWLVGRYFTGTGIASDATVGGTLRLCPRGRAAHADPNHERLGKQCSGCHGDQPRHPQSPPTTEKGANSDPMQVTRPIRISGNTLEKRANSDPLPGDAAQEETQRHLEALRHVLKFIEEQQLRPKPKAAGGEQGADPRSQGGTRQPASDAQVDQAWRRQVEAHRQLEQQKSLHDELRQQLKEQRDLIDALRQEIEGLKRTRQQPTPGSSGTTPGGSNSSGGLTGSWIGPGWLNLDVGLTDDAGGLLVAPEGDGKGASKPKEHPAAPR